MKITSISVLFCLAITTFSYDAFSQIADRRIYNNIYKSCTKTPQPQWTYSEGLKYCRCIADGVTKSLTVRDVIALEMNLKAAKDKETRMRIAVSNAKFKNVVTNCLLKIYK
jgi:hypothetical protein